MAKRLVILIDGTWNVPANNTNVWRLNSLVERGGSDPAQVVYYQKGIGTDPTNRIRGAFGKGVNGSVRQAYDWLSRNYALGDEIFVFGFSRGAYIARSLCGFVSRCGVLRPGGPLSICDAFEKYRGDGREPQNSAELKPLRTDPGLVRYSRYVPIEFLGLWDTVRYSDLPIGSVRGISRSVNASHAIQPGANVHRTFQALAIDEHRKAYKAELCHADDLAADASIEQRWFIGAHSNVGGGYRDDTLAMISLRWIQSCAEDAGLRFGESVLLYGDEHLGPVTDSFGQFLGGAYAHLGSRRLLRPIGSIRSKRIIEPHRELVRESIDASVFARWQQDISYRPQNLADLAESKDVDLASVEGSLLL